MFCSSLDITRTVNLKLNIQEMYAVMFLFFHFYLKENRRVEQRVLEEAEHTLGGDLTGLVAPGGHQEARGRGEGSREAAHLPTLTHLLGMLSL